ncbi:hypothetical protein HPB48_015710 [Haemaphysalis longicornis]|uniref:Uncharacterized protein n=1 Tax=Haemaphysalis longicornis TaxID=44386 RepID=A0A9J6FA26_HAELO|nr:hypothetical protein HPB48_015710 [Haemaphysalis longicornis]
MEVSSCPLGRLSAFGADVPATFERTAVLRGAQSAKRLATWMKSAMMNSGDEAAGGNAPLDAPPNTRGVARNEEAGASKAIHGEGNGTEEEKQGNHSAQTLLDPNDDDDQATPRATTSTATQKKDGSPAAPVHAGDDTNKARATAAAVAAKRPRESPGLSDDPRQKQLEREWSKVANKSKKSKVPAQQNRSASASRSFRL